MRFLLDTNVISELRKGSKMDAAVNDWQKSIDLDDCTISCLSLMELLVGAAKVKKKDPVFASRLDLWIRTIKEEAFQGRILEVNTQVIETASYYMSQRTMVVIDTLIGATAKTNGLIMVTRNIADFSDLGIDLVDPWKRA